MNDKWAYLSQAHNTRQYPIAPKTPASRRASTRILDSLFISPLKPKMAAPLLLRGIPLLCLRIQNYRLAAGILAPVRRSWCSTAETSRVDDEVISAEKTTASLSGREPAKYTSWDDTNYRKWKDKEKEILSDIEPITSLTKEILHSDRSPLSVFFFF